MRLIDCHERGRLRVRSFQPKAARMRWLGVPHWRLVNRNQLGSKIRSSRSKHSVTWVLMPVGFSYCPSHQCGGLKVELLARVSFLLNRRLSRASAWPETMAKCEGNWDGVSNPSYRRLLHCNEPWSLY